MPVIESQLVKIGIATIAGGKKSVLRLNYQSQLYDLVRVFAIHKLESTAPSLPDRIAQQLQQLLGVRSRDAVINALANGYLLVRESGYYSLWQLARSTLTVTNSSVRSEREGVGKLGLQQASIWLFQELWLQLDELLGDRQLQQLSESLIAITPHVRSWVDLDRLSTLDPLTAKELTAWSEEDSIAFSRELYHLTQKKLGHEFGTKLTIEIVRSMPDALSQSLERVLNL
jgi:hypothetical protein